MASFSEIYWWGSGTQRHQIPLNNRCLFWNMECYSQPQILSTLWAEKLLRYLFSRKAAEQSRDVPVKIKTSNSFLSVWMMCLDEGQQKRVKKQIRNNLRVKVRGNVLDTNHSIKALLIVWPLFVQYDPIGSSRTPQDSSLNCTCLVYKAEMFLHSSPPHLLELI